MLGLLSLGLGAASFISDALNRKAARDAAAAQAEAQQQNIDMMNKRYSEMQTMLQPYTSAGQGAIQQQQALSGALGPEAQKAAVEGISNSEGFQASVAQGENALLQNASATGGLRGGNTQGALAQFAPQMLNQAINQRYGQLGGLAQMGLSAGNALGAAGMNSAGVIGDMNSAMAGFNSQPGAGSDLFSSALTGLGSGLGAYTGLGGTFGQGGGSPSGNQYGSPLDMKDYGKTLGLYGGLK